MTFVLYLPCRTRALALGRPKWPIDLCSPATVRSIEIVERGIALDGQAMMMPTKEIWPTKVRINLACASGKAETADLKYYVYRDPYGKWTGDWDAN